MLVFLPSRKALSPVAQCETGRRSTTQGRGRRFDFLSLLLCPLTGIYFPQVDSIREGMSAIIPWNTFALYTANEMESKVCGTSDISVDALKVPSSFSAPSLCCCLLLFPISGRCCRRGPWFCDPCSLSFCKNGVIHLPEFHSGRPISLLCVPRPQVVVNMNLDPPEESMFWECMERFTPKDRSEFLRFACGYRRLPPNPAAFPIRINVRSTGRVFPCYHSPVLTLTSPFGGDWRPGVFHGDEGEGGSDTIRVCTIPGTGRSVCISEWRVSDCSHLLQQLLHSCVPDCGRYDGQVSFRVWVYRDRSRLNHRVLLLYSLSHHRGMGYYLRLRAVEETTRSITQ